MNSPYRLLKRGTTFISRYWIYRGEDHLLLMDQVLFTENYYRFYYRDIQGLVAVRTPHFWVFLGIMGPSLVFLLLGISKAVGGASGPGTGLLITLPAFPFITSGIYVLFGRTCRMTIVTRVQSKQLGGIIRWKKWLSIRDLLVAVINLEQKEILAAELKPELTTNPATPAVQPDEQNPDSAPTLQTPP
jgi:hypothetical protein